MSMALFIIVLIMSAAGCSALLRWAGMGVPARVLGGFLAGMLLGPTIFGAVAPQQFRQLVIGGAAPWEQRRLLIRRHGADVLALERTLIDQQQVAESQRAFELQLHAIDQQIAESQGAHQRPLVVVASATSIVLLLAGGFFSVRSRDERQRWGSPISIGAWSAAIPGALGYAAARWWWEFEPMEAAFVASALAIGPWAIVAVDQEAADQAEFGGARMVQTAGRIASAVAMTIAIAATAGFAPNSIWSIAIAAAALLIGWIAGARLSVHLIQRIHLLCQWIVIPTLSALLMLRINLIEAAAFWPVVVIALLSGDGRWFGALVGAMLPGGRQALRSMRLVMGSMAAGPTQLAIAAIGICGGFLSPTCALALAGGIAVMELSAPLRREMASRLAQAEDELNDAQS